MTTIETYLQGLFTYTFTSQNMTSVLLKRGIEEGSDWEDVSEQNRELAQADLYMILFNAFSKSNDTVQKGNWKRSSGSMTVGVTDRKMFRDQANAIYSKYDEAVVGYTGMTDGTFLWQG